MVKEEYVTFETAKLLKEKGFDEECWCYYHKQKLEHYFRKVSNKGWTTSGNISSPTQQMACRWLREIHNLCVAPYAAAYRYGFTIDKADTGSGIGNEYDFYPEDEFETWEEACEAGILYCLKNLL